VLIFGTIYPTLRPVFTLPAAAFRLLPIELLRTAQMNERNKATARRSQTMRVVISIAWHVAWHQVTPPIRTSSTQWEAIVQQNVQSDWGPPSHTSKENTGPSLVDKAESFPSCPLNLHRVLRVWSEGCSSIALRLSLVLERFQIYQTLYALFA
jgi:hypothetical protein